jgi:hypothetical protein
VGIKKDARSYARLLISGFFHDVRSYANSTSEALAIMRLAMPIKTR